MRFDKIVQAKIGQYLKRIRIKVDPTHGSAESFQFIDGYEGFILAEDTETIQIMVVKQNMPVVDVPRDALVAVNPADRLKEFASSFLSMNSLESSDYLVKDVQSCDDFEAMLRRSGITDSELLQFYRQYAWQTTL